MDKNQAGTGVVPAFFVRKTRRKRPESGRSGGFIPESGDESAG
jgi:hypothetical protein